MKKIAVHILATTGLSLLVLCLIGVLSNAKMLYISSVFETFIVNLMIHLWLLMTQKIEFRHVTVEFAIDIGFIFILLVICGGIWEWFESTPIWVLAIIAVVLYVISFFFNLLRMQQEVNEINELLHRRDEIIRLESERKRNN